MEDGSSEHDVTLSQADILHNCAPVPRYAIPPHRGANRTGKVMKRGSSVSGPIVSPPVFRTSQATHVDGRVPEVTSLDAFLNDNAC